MENITSIITSNKILLLIIILICAIILYAILKKLMKLAIILLIALGLYAGYLYYTGQKIPTSKKEAIQYSKEEYNKLKNNGKKTIDKVIKKN